MRFSNYCVSLIISSRPSFRICLMASNGVKPCVSLVDDAKAVEDAAIVLEETLEKFQDSHGLSRKDLAPLRLVSNVLTNVTSSVKRNAKALSPGNGDPEWIAKRKERDRKVIRLSNGPIPQSRKSTPTGSMEHYNREKAQNNKENDGRRQESAPFQPNFAPPVASRTRNTPLIPSPCNGFKFECVEAMRVLARTTANLRPLLIHWHEKRWIPVHFRTCCALLKKCNAGESVAWKGVAVDGTNRGRKTFCSADEFQQMADLAPIFRGMKQGSKLVTALGSHCATLPCQETGESFPKKRDRKCRREETKRSYRPSGVPSLNAN